MPVDCVVMLLIMGHDNYAHAVANRHVLCRFEQIETPSHFAIWTDPEPVSNSILSFLRKE